MILDDNLQVVASMNGINRTPGHAMWVGTRPAGGGDQKVIQASTSAEQAWDRDAVRFCSVSFDTASGACIASRAVIQIEHENALTFKKTLFDILIEHSVTYGRAIQTSDRLLDYPSAKDAKFA